MFEVTEQAFNLGAARVLNRGLMKARTLATRAISNDLKIKPQRLIRVRMRIDRASSRHLAGRLRMLDNPMSMSRLALQQVKSKGGGVTVAGQGMQIGAFIAAKRGTLTQQVFRRESRNRYPLKALKVTISLVARGHLRSAVETAMIDVPSDLEREMAFRVNYVAPGSYRLSDRQAAVAEAQARMAA